jgi:hypothetical protein
VSGATAKAAGADPATSALMTKTVAAAIATIDEIKALGTRPSTRAGGPSASGGRIEAESRWGGLLVEPTGMPIGPP